MKNKFHSVLRKNECIPLTITDMTSEGAGIGKYQGIAVFVPMSAVGDELTVRILKVAKNYAFGKIEEILCSASNRIPADCPYFQQCGGCVYRHILYEAELAAKEKRVLDALTRIGGFETVPCAPIRGAQNRNHYRNKGLLPLGSKPDGSLQMGFYAVHSHRIVDCNACLLQPEAFTKIMQIFRKWQAQHGDRIYDEQSHKGNLRRLYMRKAEATGELMVCIVTKNGMLRHGEELVALLTGALPAIKSIIINHNPDKTNVALGQRNHTIYGKDSITDILCGLQFHISPLSFYQINRTQAETLYEKAAEYAQLTGSQVVLDLYCGTGTIGLSMAKHVKKLIGIDIIPDAVENAKLNAEENGIFNAEFLCGDAADAAQLLHERGEKPDVILLDPPRKGCAPELLETVLAFSPERIVYISCDPATLARDLRILADAGYSLRACAPFDLFPATAHVETIVLMSRKKEY